MRSSRTGNAPPAFVVWLRSRAELVRQRNRYLALRQAIIDEHEAKKLEALLEVELDAARARRASTCDRRHELLLDWSRSERLD